MGRTKSGRIVLGTLAAVIVLTASVSLAEPYKRVADPYKWCVVYGGDDGGGPNCGFLTWDQCMATAFGNGGFCRESMWYTGPADKPASTRRKKHSAR